jgi:hypothetical protein
MLGVGEAEPVDVADGSAVPLSDGDPEAESVGPGVDTSGVLADELGCAALEGGGVEAPPPGDPHPASTEQAMADTAATNATRHLLDQKRWLSRICPPGADSQ